MELIFNILVLLFAVFSFVIEINITYYLIRVLYNIIFKLGGLLVIIYSTFNILVITGVVSQQYLQLIKNI